MAFLVCFSSACAPPAATQQTPQTTATSEPPSACETQIPPTQLSPVPACQQAGYFERYSIDSVLMNGQLAFSVYFPPCYDPQAAEPYPVLYLLHGQRQDDALWQNLGAGQAADALILSGVVRPFLMVMPYEEFFFRAPDQTAFPQALLEELLPWAEENLLACAERDCRAIGGISRGASWAVRLGLTEWKTFAALGAHSLPTFNGDLQRLNNWLQAIPRISLPRIYVDIGTSDPSVKNAYRFEQELNTQGVTHEWHLNPGRHDEAYWRVWMAEYIRWYSLAWLSE